MKSHQIRQEFLNFFKEKQHLIVPSAPIVLKNDPTLMFNNSGMAQFKEFFLGNAVPKSKRIVDTQKCLRVSGKHNDLEDVGFDTYHHTMFEMLGNWSFGDYFKEEAINWAWELLTKVYKIPKENLYVSVFEGNEAENVPFDQEAWNIWKSLIDEDRIILGNKKDNFWEMGDQGPCGPCSEIHVDLRTEEEKKQVSGKSLVNNDHPQVVEIWNNVFMEFNRKADGSLEKLPAKHVDTGMGFERLCMALQGKTSNYDTDVFTPLIKKVEEITGINYTTNEIKTVSQLQNKHNIAIRVVVDHVRAVAFAIADGQLTSNTGAGYVIRRILRRAIRYGFTFLNTKEPYIYQLVDVLAQQMGDFFPEISSQKQLVENVIKEEETSFLKTLDQGLQLLDKLILDSKSKEILGSRVFELKDTFGFPEDLTELILREKGFSYNKEEFNIELENQRKRGKLTVERDDWNILINDNSNEFIGFDFAETEAKINRYRKIKNDKGTFYQLVFNQTTFYPEGGGQVGDVGLIKSNSETIKVIETKKENNLIIHLTKELPKELEATFYLEINKEKRNNSAKNHTATHLLQEALREVLGSHVEQKGSLVNDEYLRFDFSHFQKVSKEELSLIEQKINSKIEQAIKLEENRALLFTDAIKMGATALFGEKYGDVVRGIKFDSSFELCGGTHVDNTSKIQLVVIKSESSVAAGIRRIEAISGSAAINYLRQVEEKFNTISSLLNAGEDSITKINSLLSENQQIKKQLEVFLKEKVNKEKAKFKNLIKEINGLNTLFTTTDLDNSQVKDIAFNLRNELQNLLLVVVSTTNNTPTITVALSDSVVKNNNLNASLIVKKLAIPIKGGGGGQPFFATAGGKDINGVNEVLEIAKTLVLE